MQSLTEWQKYRLRKVGIHPNIQFNSGELSHSGNNFNTGLEQHNEDIVETRRFSFIMIVLCSLVIIYRY